MFFLLNKLSWPCKRFINLILDEKHVLYQAVFIEAFNLKLQFLSFIQSLICNLIFSITAACFSYLFNTFWCISEANCIAGPASYQVNLGYRQIMTIGTILII